MRAEGLKCGLVLISLVFALALSITLLAMPVLAEAVISEPGGTTIEVEQGQEFDLSFRLQWDEPDPGFFAITLKWFCPENNPAENFTLVSVSAAFDDGTPINAAVTSEFKSPLDSGTLYSRVIGTPAGDPNNGPFNVNITFLAGSEGFAHIPTGNHPIEIEGTILVAEALPWVEYYPPDPVITVRVPGRSVDVKTSLPDYQIGPPGATLSYTVTVTNTGAFDENYDLTPSDDAGWGPTLDNYLFQNVQPGENRIATLSVTIPENAVPCTEDNIKVTATSQADTNVSDFDTCVAHAENVKRKVEVSISPSDQNAPLGETLTYTVTVKNEGNIADNYDLVISENADPRWNPTLSDNLVDNRLENLQPGENRLVTLNVTIPVDAVIGTEDNITVTATSQENIQVSDNASCIARAFSTRWVEIAVSPEYQVSPPGKPLPYTVTVTNTGNVEDTYALTVGDNAGWISEEWVFYSTLSDGSIENTTANYLDTHNAPTGTIRNNVETANIGQVRDVDFTIWRTFLFFDTSRIPDGAAITSATLSLYGHADWSDENFDVVVQNGQPTYPHDPLEPGDYDNTYYGDNGGSLNTSNFKTDNYNDITLNGDGRSWIDKTGTTKFCLRSSRDNEGIEPSGLYEFIEVFMSEAGENYKPKLTVTLSRTISRLTIPKGENRTATFDVTIPEDTAPGTRDSITFTATSRADSAVSDYASCVALAGEVDFEVSISPSRQSGMHHDDLYLAEENYYDLKYIVWVTNRGTIPDTYALTVKDTRDWDWSLPKPTGTVAAGENENWLLFVNVHRDEKPKTEDNIVVTVTSQTDNRVSHNMSCIAQAALVDMEVTISPSYQKGSPGENIVYLLTVKNTGDSDNPTTFSLPVPSDNAEPSWGPTIDHNRFTLASGERATTKIRVMVPDSATHRAMDNLTVLVLAPSQRYEENGVEKYSVDKEVSCIAQAETVKLFISPGVDSSKPGEDLTFTVLVKNVGIENDDYDLTVSDDAGWGLSLPENSLKDVTPGETRQATLSITIPEEAEPGTEDNVVVTVIPGSVPTEIESENCVAIAAPQRGVRVSISPKVNSGVSGATLGYAVVVKNIGTENDSYELAASDSAGWGLELSENVMVVPGLSRRGTVLRVTNVVSGMSDDITVTAISRENSEVRAEGRCTAVGEALRATVYGSKTSYNNDGDEGQGGPPPENWYVAGDYPPVMFAEKYGDGGVAALGIGAGLRNERWNPDTNPGPHLDILLDKTFQWMNSGAKKVAWYEAYGVYTQQKITEEASQMGDALRALGYDLTPDTTEPISAIDFSAYDIVVLPCIQLGDQYTGGDPDLLPDDDVTALVDFVSAGGGLLVMNNADYAGYNFHKVSNKVLAAFNVPFHFQNDTLGDPITWTYYSYILEVNAVTEIGEAYRSATGTTLLGIYSPHTLVEEAPPLPPLEVRLFVSPEEKVGLSGRSLTYTITVNNTGQLSDAYVLSASDNAGWSLSLLPSVLMLAGGASDHATLTVNIPENVARGTEDMVTIAVESVEGIGDVGQALTVVGVLGVDVSISPESQSGSAGENLRFAVTILNSGDILDNYLLTVEDNLGWDLVLSPDILTTPVGRPRWSTLTVTIPEGAASGVQNNITVTATSQTDNKVSAEGSCIALATVGRGVNVLISPTSKSGAPGKELNFDVTVTNTGTETDTFSLTASDTEGWGPTLSITSIPSLAGGASKTGIQLSVKIPDDAAEGDSTTITVTASGTGYENSASCTARAVIRGVEVSISPESRTGSLGENVTFTVMVTNTSEVEDSYDLTVSDDAGWGAVLSEDLLTVPAGEDGTTTVSVTVPSDATEGESTTITVTATSRSDPTARDTATCTAEASEKAPLPIVPIGVGGAVIGVGIALTLLVKKGMISVPFLRSRRRGMFSSMDLGQSRPSRRGLLNPGPFRSNPGKKRRFSKKWL